MRVLRAAQFLGLTAAFLLYRAWRGFFVILPAVFRSVEAKLSDSVTDLHPFKDDELSAATTSLSGAGGPLDVDPSTGRVKRRANLTVSALALLLTFVYAARGIAGVLFFAGRNVWKGRSFSAGVEAAEAEFGRNQRRLQEMGERG